MHAYLHTHTPTPTFRHTHMCILCLYAQVWLYNTERYIVCICLCVYEECMKFGCVCVYVSTCPCVTCKHACTPMLTDPLIFGHTQKHANLYDIWFLIFTPSFWSIDRPDSEVQWQVDVDSIAYLFSSLVHYLQLGNAYNIFVLNPKRDATQRRYGYR